MYSIDEQERETPIFAFRSPAHRQADKEMKTRMAWYWTCLFAPMLRPLATFSIFKYKIDNICKLLFCQVWLDKIGADKSLLSGEQPVVGAASLHCRFPRRGSEGQWERDHILTQEVVFCLQKKWVMGREAIPETF